MPRAELPLNIFEPRYLDMVSDALATHHMIGMVQPDPSASGEGAPIYGTGCAGRITSYTELRDGRILLSLTGVCRFDIVEELPANNRYRSVRPRWSRFLGDLESEPTRAEPGKSEILRHLKRYFEFKKLETDWEVIERLSVLELVHTMTTLMPLEPVDKQSILECESLSDRARALCSALEFGVAGSMGGKPH
ncbi:MAG: LON peptidase substrate-binding domain-containing protein [Gammaproteobacteria bacterium]|nr:LON peptidase substrate-binding domain-containing protein [Gammaproteobacteria bacterium]